MERWEFYEIIFERLFVKCQQNTLSGADISEIDEGHLLICNSLYRLDYWSISTCLI